MVGYNAGGVLLPSAHDGSLPCDPPLTARQRAITAHHALLNLGLSLARNPVTAHAARTRLEASKRLAAETGVPAVMDIDALLSDVDAAERALAEQAMKGVERGSWHACPNGHQYLIGECGRAMELSSCPDCRAAVGGGNHTLVGGNTRRA
jgi:hypothetical protein